MASRKKESGKSGEKPERKQIAVEPSPAAGGKKLCAYQDCGRPVWGKHGEKEFCLFHSEKVEEKKEEFKAEIEKFKRGETGQFLRKDGKGKEYFDFVGFRFPDGCSDFGGHTFEKAVNFSRAAFSGEADFREAAFSGEADFHGTAFRSAAYFSRSKFGGAADFEGVGFNTVAFFFNAAFSGMAIFLRAAFSGGAYFRGAAFSGVSDFQMTAFSSDADFQGTVFRSAANFSEAKFVNKADFRMSSFNDVDFKFIKAKSLLLANTRIEGKVSLASARIKYIDTDLFGRKEGKEPIKVKIAAGVEEEEEEVREEEIVKDKRREAEEEEPREAKEEIDEVERAEERRAFFLKDAVLIDSGIRSIGFIGWIDSKEEKYSVPLSDLGWKVGSFNLHWLCGRPREALLDEVVAFSRGKKDPERLKRFKMAESLYRTLKHKMREQHAEALARRMRAGELETRFLSTKNFAEKAFLRFYRFLNGYGLRWLRALLLWGVCVAGLALAYNGQASLLDGHILTMNIHDAFRHSIEVASVITRPRMTISNTWYWWLEIGEKIASPILLGLFAQALSHRLRD